jgi:Flp pilus assembly protein TadB
MRGDSVQPSVSIYQRAIKFACAARKPAEADEHLRRMKEEGVEVTQETVLPLIELYNREGESGKAEHVQSLIVILILILMLILILILIVIVIVIVLVIVMVIY